MARLKPGGATLTSSTISGNIASSGGTGIFNFTGFSVSRSTIDHTDSDGLCITASTSANDGSGLNLKLVALASNGGPTQTMALQAKSPALDQVVANAATCAGADQRGSVRPVGARCDIGAVEMDFDTVFCNGLE